MEGNEAINTSRRELRFRDSKTEAFFKNLANRQRKFLAFISKSECYILMIFYILI